MEVWRVGASPVQAANRKHEGRIPYLRRAGRAQAPKTQAMRLHCHGPRVIVHFHRGHSHWPRTLKPAPEWEPCSGRRSWDGGRVMEAGGRVICFMCSLGPRSLAPCGCGRTAAWHGPHPAGLLGVCLACFREGSGRKADSRCDSVMETRLAGPLWEQGLVWLFGVQKVEPRLNRDSRSLRS